MNQQLEREFEDKFSSYSDHGGVPACLACLVSRQRDKVKEWIDEKFVARVEVKEMLEKLKDKDTWFTFNLPYK